MRGPKYPGVPFDQQMNFPTVMELRTTADGIRVFRNPVEEIKLLYNGQKVLEEQTVSAGSNLLADLGGDLYDMTFATDAADSFDVEIRGAKIHYDAAARTISAEGPVVGGKRESLGSAPLRLAEGTLTLRILVDRTSLEIFADGGETVITSNFMPAPDNFAYALAPATQIHLLRAEINTLKSSWE
jgi:levanase/fructan beta-fructosidase